MKVVVLSPYPEKLLPTIEQTDDVIVYNGPSNNIPEADLGISFGYRSIIKKSTLARLPVANLHISYLPWNRGADPNFWSWVDNTPKGVTIHWIDEGIDTGPIICQLQAAMTLPYTLRTSYDHLQMLIVFMFAHYWPDIRKKVEGKPQVGEGSYHRVKDKEKLWAELPMGFDTPVTLLTTLKQSAGPITFTG